jgi:hypothetical protein
MQDLQGLVVKNFENKGNIILGKAEIDIDRTGNFVELQDVKSFNIQSNITNIFQNTCAISFNINLLNTKDRYSFYNKGASCYGYIKEGKNIRLYLGARLKPKINKTILGVIDEYGIGLDGGLTYENETEGYVVVRNEEVATYLNSDSPMITIGQWKENTWYGIQKGYLYFDTSIIPIEATITKIILKIAKDSGTPIVDFNIVIQSGMPDYPNNPLQESDFNRLNYSGDGGRVNTAGWAAGEIKEIEFTEEGRGWINRSDHHKNNIKDSKRQRNSYCRF